MYRIESPVTLTDAKALKGAKVALPGFSAWLVAFIDYEEAGPAGAGWYAKLQTACGGLESWVPLQSLANYDILPA